MTVSDSTVSELTMTPTEIERPSIGRAGDDPHVRPSGGLCPRGRSWSPRPSPIERGA